jgi:hypothetical protein
MNQTIARAGAAESVADRSTSHLAPQRAWAAQKRHSGTSPVKITTELIGIPIRRSLESRGEVPSGSSNSASCTCP